MKKLQSYPPFWFFDGDLVTCHEPCLAYKKVVIDSNMDERGLRRETTFKNVVSIITCLNWARLFYDDKFTYAAFDFELTRYTPVQISTAAPTLIAVNSSFPNPMANAAAKTGCR